MNKYRSIAMQAIEAGYTHQEIADKCGCERSTITRLIRGGIQNPRANVVDGLYAIQRKLRRTA